MTLKELISSRALWRSREKYRHGRYVYHRDKTRRTALAAKWKRLYLEARERRVRRDRQIEAARKPTGVSSKCVDLVAEFEGFRARPYRDPVGVWTIGYGETRGVGPNTEPWTKSYARQRLRERLNRDFYPAVRAANSKLTQNEVDGFTSFVYNVGIGGVSDKTTVGRRLRANDVRGAADAILAWNKAGGKVWEGLTRRRKAERALILK